MYKIVLTGGGTAGHVWPLIVVADELRHRAHCRFLYLGSRVGIERDLVPHLLPFHAISVGKLRRYFDFQNLLDPFRALAGYFQAKQALERFGPDLVLAKGGYVSLPVVLAARSLGVPVLVHESDVVFGLANRIAAKHALFVLVGFPKKFYLPAGEASGDLPFVRKLVYTGIPVRPEFFRHTKAYLHHIGFDPRLRTLLVMGGSQGAQRINYLVSRIIGQLLEEFQVIHLSGSLDLGWLSAQRAKLPLYQRKRYHLASFLKREFPQAVNAVDLVLSRAGASTLAELAVAEKPAVLLPLATAASSHQLKNAEIFGQAGAAVVLDDHQAPIDQLLATVQKLLRSDFRLKKMAAKMSLLVKPDAANHIAKIIIEVLGKG